MDPETQEKHGLSKGDMENLAGVVVELSSEQIKTRMAEIQTELNSQLEAGLAPDNEKVQALERALVEKEEQIQAQHDKYREEMRLLRSEMGLVGQQYIRAEGGPVDPLRVDYGGSICKRDVMEAIVRQFSDTPEIVRSSTGDFTTLTPTIDVLGGKIGPDVLDRFIDLIVQETASISRYQTRRMSSPDAKLDQIQIAARTIRTPVEGSDSGHGAAAISYPARVLQVAEVSFIHDITLSFLEDNIMKANAEAQIASALARQFGTDLNDLGVNGVGSGVVGGDADFLNLKQGWYSIINGLTYDGVGGNPVAAQQQDLTAATTATEVLGIMNRNIPDRFKARSDYAFHVPPNTAQLYAEETSVRETGLGDSVLVGGFPNLRYFGRPVYPEPHLQANAATSGQLDTSGMALLTPTVVPVFGVHRNMRMDAEWRPRKRAIEYTVTARVGYQIAAVETHVQGINIPAALK